VYCYAGNTVFCIDAGTGLIHWRKVVGSSSNYLNETNLLLTRNSLIARSSKELYALDKRTGNVIWEKNDLNVYSPAGMMEHSGKLWFTCQSLLAIDLNTGDTKIETADAASLWSNSISHHPTLGRVYTGDEDFIFCLDYSRLK
jgi:outer membrane protein assembly factor BamB